MPPARARSQVTLTAFGALMDPDYLRQATNDPCAAVAQSERVGPGPLAALTRWWASFPGFSGRARRRSGR